MADGNMFAVADGNRGLEFVHSQLLSMEMGFFSNLSPCSM